MPNVSYELISNSPKRLKTNRILVDMKLYRLLPFFIAFLFFSACDNEPHDPTFEKKYLIGKWELTDAWRNNKKTETLTGTYYEFGEDGMMKTNLTTDLTEKEFPYEFDGRSITQKGTQNVVYSLDSLSEAVLIFSMSINNFPFRLVLAKVAPSEKEL